MRNKVSIIIAFLLCAFKSFAVLNEQSLEQTISVLRAELEKTYKEEAIWKAKYDTSNQQQHQIMLETIQESEKISLMLYSQKEDYIFDMAYACHEATMQYQDFKGKRMPFDLIVKKLDAEIERYTLLIETLESIPPVKRKHYSDSTKIAKQKEDSLRKAIDAAFDAYEAEKYGKAIDSAKAVSKSGSGINIFGHQLGGDTAAMSSAEAAMRQMAALKDSLTLAKARELAKEYAHDEGNGINDMPSAPKSAKKFNMAAMKQFVLSPESQAERDSCVTLSKRILADFIATRDYIIKDQKLYERIDTRLKNVNDYALETYDFIQHNIFTNGGTNYFHILSNFPWYLRVLVNDIRDKYTNSIGNVHSDWTGPTIIGLAIFILGFFFLSAFLANIALKIYGRFRQLNKTFVPYYAVSLACITFTVILSMTKVIISQNFFAMACSRLIEYVLLIAAITLSLVYRTKEEQIKSAFSCYFPILLMGLIIIVFRIMFVPNNIVQILFPLILVFFTVWGFRSVSKYHLNIPKYDEIYAWVSFAIMTVACVMAWLGYALLAVEVFIWWLVQLTCIQSLTFLYEYMKKFEASHVAPKILKEKGFQKEDTEEYKERLQKKIRQLQAKQGDYITHTWFLDFVMKCVIPACAVLSFLLCIYLATDIFDLTAMCKDIFLTNFLDIDGLCQLSLFKIVVVLELYFIFNFIAYVLRSIYKHWKFKNKNQIEIEKVNITLINNIIGIVIWGIFIITILFLLQVPKGGISIVTAGLATGLGFAMRDMINNFFYGIILMTGRVRVGDFVECDGVRGKIESITYQSTQLITLDGCVIAFLNSTLFTKSFKNLTRNHGYELIKVPFGVAYGTNIEKVRQVVISRMNEILRKDFTNGKPDLDPEKNISVYFESMEESSVDLSVSFWGLVERRYFILVKAKEIVYNVLNENGIEIPFPQRDVHIKP